ncbi:MAG: DNA alkylation repair protein [Clostridia bacterium]|nr:DNA alkylation repair protein [Clostridia bacterium]
MTDTVKRIRDLLFEEKDEGYKAFQSPLLPGISPDSMIGVRTPVLRHIAKKMTAEEKEEFISTLPHRYYEENNLHAYVLSLEKNFEKCFSAIDAFLPYIDNWATCDGLRPICIKENEDRLLTYIYRWLDSGECYTIRFATEMLMLHYMKDNFRNEYPQKIAGILSEEYYVNMMSAWYFATLITKRWDDGIKYLEEHMLSPFVHAKTISKVCDSLAVPREKKEYVKKLR